jgi:hypothetical protein
MVGSVCRINLFTTGSVNSLKDFSRAAHDGRPGRPVEIGTGVTVQLVVELIRAGRRITKDSVATNYGVPMV